MILKQFLVFLLTAKEIEPLKEPSHKADKTILLSKILSITLLPVLCMDA